MKLLNVNASTGGSLASSESGREDADCQGHGRGRGRGRGTLLLVPLLLPFLDLRERGMLTL
jgi:hypothetical protein